MKTALITGFTGQDGTYLTDLLLKKGYIVVGMVRRISTEPPMRTRGVYDFKTALKQGNLILEPGDLLSPTSLRSIIDKHKPDEVYNLAAQSHVGLSFDQPEVSIQTTFEGVVNLISALESADYNGWRMYQASSSEMFGDPAGTAAITEKTPLQPNSPYAIAKAASHQYCGMKRQEGRFISCGILFNHESEIRGGDFVTQKIARKVAEWKILEPLPEESAAPHPSPLELGNLDAARDWGHAEDYVRAMHEMLLHDEPGDYIIGTGKSRTVRQFVDACFAGLGKKVEWRGEGIGEQGFIDGELAVVVNKDFFRPVDVGHLRADSSKARRELVWSPKVDFPNLVTRMVRGAYEGRP